MDVQVHDLKEKVEERFGQFLQQMNREEIILVEKDLKTAGFGTRMTESSWMRTKLLWALLYRLMTSPFHSLRLRHHSILVNTTI